MSDMTVGVRDCLGGLGQYAIQMCWSKVLAMTSELGEQPAKRKDKALFRVSPPVMVHADWLAKAAQMFERTFQCAFVLAFLARRAGSAAVVVHSQTLSRFGLSRDAVGDAFSRLVKAWLVTANRKRGRSAFVWLSGYELSGSQAAR